MKYSAIANDQNGVERRLTVEAPTWEAVERGLAERKFTAIRRAEDSISLVEVSSAAPAAPAAPVVPVVPAAQHAGQAVVTPATLPGMHPTQVVQVATFIASVFAVWGLVFMVTTDVIRGSFLATDLLWYSRYIIWTGLCVYLLLKPELLARIVPKRIISFAMMVPMACGLYFILTGVESVIDNFIRLCMSLADTEHKSYMSSGENFRYVVIAGIKVGLGFVIMHKAESLASLAKLSK